MTLLPCLLIYRISVRLSCWTKRIEVRNLCIQLRHKVSKFIVHITYWHYVKGNEESFQVFFQLVLQHIMVNVLNISESFLYNSDQNRVRIILSTPGPQQRSRGLFQSTSWGFYYNALALKIYIIVWLIKHFPKWIYLIQITSILFSIFLLANLSMIF